MISISTKISEKSSKELVELMHDFRVSSKGAAINAILEESADARDKGCII